MKDSHNHTAGSVTTWLQQSDMNGHPGYTEHWKRVTQGVDDTH
jgi:hypothetical protein